MKQLENLNENDLCFYDIETARAVKVLEEGTPIYDAWKYKARYQNELNKKTGQEYTLEEYYYEKAPLYAPFGRVVTIVVGRIKDNKIYLKSYASYDEKELLQEFNRDLELVYQSNPKTRFVSFNGVGFDTPYLEKRSIINGVKPSTLLEESHLEPWKVTQLDLSKIWKGNAFYPDSLVAVASALGLPSPKDALDGSEVSNAFYEGRLDEIVTYCLKDVETTARVYRKLAFLPDLEEGFEIIGGKVEVEELPLLQRIYKATNIDSATKEKIQEKLSKTKLTKKDKEILEDILTSLYINNTMFSSDSPAIKEQKKLEIKQLING
jgi:hypothetical protein